MGNKNKIKDKEKLAVLGFFDSDHSLFWYREKFPDLPAILEDFIINTVNDFDIFPKDAQLLKSRFVYQQFYMIIKKINNDYYVLVNNTDRGEVSGEYCFNDLREAAKFLIYKSFTAGGSIRKYWKLKDPRRSSGSSGKFRGPANR